MAIIKEENKIKATIALLSFAIFVSIIDSPIALLILIVVGFLTANLYKTKRIHLGLSVKEFIPIFIYSIIFPVSLALGHKTLQSIGLVVSVPFLSMCYLFGGLVSFIVRHPIGYPLGAFIAIYFQVHWFYVLYRAKRTEKNA
jgi:hypothetical protein